MGALRLTMALPDRSWNLTRTSTSATNRTPQQWNQDKTSIAEVKLNKRCSMPYVNINIYVEAVKGQAVEIRGVWKRTRTRTLWNQDKTSIALVARLSLGPVTPINVDGVEADGGAGAGARGVLERKTRAWTRNRTP